MFKLVALISQIISIYSILCFARILLSWIPSLSYSKVTQFLAKICDPYLNLFRKLPLQFASLDLLRLLHLSYFLEFQAFYKLLLQQANFL